MLNDVEGKSISVGPATHAYYTYMTQSDLLNYFWLIFTEFVFFNDTATTEIYTE